jgi:hypothetical protein
MRSHSRKTESERAEALKAFNCDGNTLAPVVAALMLVALKPFLAAFKVPASTALLTCIASYIDKHLFPRGDDSAEMGDAEPERVLLGLHAT